MVDSSQYVSFTTDEEVRPSRRFSKWSRIRAIYAVLGGLAAAVLVSSIFIFARSADVSPATLASVNRVSIYDDAGLGDAHDAVYGEPFFVQAFEEFMRRYNKSYSADERAQRFLIFKKNPAYIKAHNENNFSFRMRVNKFADLSFEEFRAKYVGYKAVPKAVRLGVDNSLASVDPNSLPKEVDWNQKGCVTNVKNQEQCGSCWAFSATGSLEGAHCVASGKLVSLSEQHLVDCATKEGNMGCRGGDMEMAFKYVQRVGGLCTEEDYPYEARDGKCRASKCTPQFKISGWSEVPHDNADALRAAVAKYGPVAIAIEADQMPFQFYSGGVFKGACGTNLDHGVLVVGYGTENGEDYFLVKNSWGASWGDNGYIKMTANGGKHGECGMFMDPSYPLMTANDDSLVA